MNVDDERMWAEIELFLSTGNQAYLGNLDKTASYASNEIAINWNAALVGFIGWLDNMQSKKGSE